MKGNVRDQIFSLSSIAIAVGVAGFTSALVTMFINTMQTTSIKWIIFLSWVFVTILVILIKVINDQSKIYMHPQSSVSEKPIRYMPDKGLILIRKNDFFLNNTMVGCYCIDGEFETIAFVAMVSHVQDKFMQIKIISDLCGESETALLSKHGIECMIIRPNIPYETLSVIGEHPDE